MTLEQYRTQIGKFIIYANIFIFFLLFSLFLLKGFTHNELTETLKLLVPIKAVYLTALVKFILINKNIDKEKKKKGIEQLHISTLYKAVTRSIIYSHILAIVVMIILCSLNIISFIAFTYSIAVIETIFGAYIGMIIGDMFKTGDEKKTFKSKHEKGKSS